MAKTDVPRRVYAKGADGIQLPTHVAFVHTSNCGPGCGCPAAGTGAFRAAAGQPSAQRARLDTGESGGFRHAEPRAERHAGHQGWLRRHDEGRAYRYEPLISAEEYSAALMRQVLAASADRPAVLMHFLGELSPEETAALEEAYQRLTRQRTPQAGTGREDAR